jgi:hypothetical protein
MKRMTGLMVVAVLAAACSGTEDTASSGTEVPAAAPDEAASDESATTDTIPEDTVDDIGSETGSDVITSFDDIPQECLDLTADFLRAIEPLVSPIDWENGTMSDFETVAPAFEAEAEAFDLASAEACGSIDLEEDGLGVIIELAAEVAPGSVAFLQFLDALQNAALGIDPTTDDAPQAFETCAEAIEFIDELVNEYPTINDVPMVDMLQVADIGTIFMSCTPEEQTFFESPEVNAFFGE